MFVKSTGLSLMKTAHTKVLKAIETTRTGDNDKKIIKEIGQDI